MIGLTGEIAAVLAEHGDGGFINSGEKWVGCLCGEHLPVTTWIDDYADYDEERLARAAHAATAVERILTARLAAVEALADEVLTEHVGTAGDFCKACDWQPTRREIDTDQEHAALRRHQATMIRAALGTTGQDVQDGKVSGLTAANAVADWLDDDGVCENRAANEIRARVAEVAAFIERS